MNWLTYAFLTIFFYAFFDFFLKLSAGKIHDMFGVTIINFLSTIIVSAFLIFAKFRNENIFQVKQGGYLYSILAGISIGLASLFFIKMFATGVNLSIGVPLVRIGIVLLAGILGALLLKESINLQYLIGFALALVGLYLLVMK